MKRKFLAVLTSVICLAAAVPSTSVYADGRKVLTLGADLNDQQRTAILNYFGVNGQNIQTLTITNQDERNHLGSYVPLEQIGTRTYSCALVSPTNSGGIQVKTANLSWVTSNMIATTLSTSGVVNCDVLAAAPFEVSGTGALTGIIMAYETAVGINLDTTKKEVATKELITTTNIANNIGQIQATEIVNESKKQVIQGDVISDNDIDIIINEVADEQNISLSEEDREMLRDLLTQIAQQDYDYEQMKETLERVESNMNDLLAKQEGDEEYEESDPEEDETETLQTAAPDSILNQTNDDALGGGVIIDATDPTTVPETEAPAQTDPSSGFEIFNSDSYSDPNPEIPATDGSGSTLNPDTEAPTADGSGSTLNPDTETPATDGEITLNPDTETPATDGEITLNPDTEAPDAELPNTDDGMLDGGFDIGVETPDETAQPIYTSEMVFAPMTSAENNYASYFAGQNELNIYLPRTDITAGTGSLSVNNSADYSVLETVEFDDTSKVLIQPMTSEELMEKSWTEGTKITVYLSKPLGQASNYYVTLSEDSLMTTDGSAHSEALSEPYWTIQTTEYGFYIDKSETSAGITAGTTASGQIMMDGTPATYAVIQNTDPNMVGFDTTEFYASGSFNATFYAAGKTTFQVAFYDAVDGNLLNTIDYTITVR